MTLRRGIGDLRQGTVGYGEGRRWRANVNLDTRKKVVVVVIVCGGAWVLTEWDDGNGSG